MSDETGTVGEMIADIEYAALLKRLATGAERTLAALPPAVAAPVHFREGPRAACTPVVRVSGSVSVYEDNYALELTTDPALVTCPTCLQSVTAPVMLAVIKPSAWRRLTAWLKAWRQHE